MSGLKAIRRRISSVKNTKQITRAMKLVSAAKLRKAQDAALGGRAYSKDLQRIVRVVLGELEGEFQHPLLQRAEKVEQRRAIVIAGDRGLCGAYNTNVLKAVHAAEGDGVETKYLALGRRAVAASKRFGWETEHAFEGLSEDAADWPVEDIARSVLEDFLSGACQEVVIYYTKFVSAMTQEVVREVVLPVTLDTETDEAPSEAVTRIERKYSPDPAQILSQTIPHLVRTKIRQSGLESKASEHAARMTAMDAATNNASDLIDKLKLFYNRARQASITTELIDIVGGAEAAQS